MTNTKAETAATSTRPRCPLPVLKARRAPNPLVAGGARDPRDQQERYKEFRTFLPHHGERGNALLLK